MRTQKTWTPQDGAWLRFLREDINLPSFKLAAQIGLAQSSLSSIEIGKSKPGKKIFPVLHAWMCERENQIDYTEEWRFDEVTGFEVSNKGRVRNPNTGRLRHPVGCGRDRKYLCVSRINGEHTVKVHIMVARCFIGVRPKGLQINHIDGNTLNNEACNLEYVTTSENIRHAFRLGLYSPRDPQRGDKNPQSKLTESEVKEIRARLNSEPRGVGKILAKKYNVSRALISRIKLGLCRNYENSPDARSRENEESGDESNNL